MRGVVFTPVVGEKFRSVVGVHAELVVAGSRDEAIVAVRGADFLVTDGSSYDAALANALIADKGQLRWVQLVSMGYDGLTQHGVPAGVVVTNVGGLYAPAVAEHAIALLLALSRRLINSAAGTATHTPDRRQARHMRTLQGAAIALIGCGRIGQEIAVRLQPFGVRLIGLARSARSDPAIGDIRPMSDLAAVLRQADGVILAVPLTAETSPSAVGGRIHAVQAGPVARQCGARRSRRYWRARRRPQGRPRRRRRTRRHRPRAPAA